MGGALRSAFIWLQSKLNLDIDLHDTVMQAAAPPPNKRKSWRAAAGTLPLAARCQLEHIASSTRLTPTSPLVLIARSLLAFGLDQSVRVQDMARSVADPDPRDPTQVIHGVHLSE